MASHPKLSTGFFQKLLENNQLEAGIKPVLQIISAQQIAQATSYRLRLSDGFFSYPYCPLGMDLTERFIADGLNEGNAVIRVPCFAVNQMNEKKIFVVLDYEIVEKNCPVIGKPQPHTGRVEDYRGFDNMQFPGSRPSHTPTQISSGTSGGEAAPSTQKRPSPTQIIDEADCNFIFEGAAGYTPHWRSSPRVPAVQPVTPIDLIIPSLRNWRVCGKVSSKSGLRDTPGPKSCRLFDFVLTDQRGSEIKFVAFGESATALCDSIEGGKTYYISGIGGIKPANKHYDPTDHQYTINLNKNARVEPCHDIIVPTKRPKLTVVSLDTIPNRVRAVVDVLAVLDSVSEPSKVPSRKDPTKSLDKRDLHLIDRSGTEVVYTLWGEKALNFDKANAGKVVAIRRALVGEFNGGYYLSTTSGTEEYFEGLPVAEVSSLLAWYNNRDSSSPDTIRISHAGAADFEANFRLIGMVQANFGVYGELNGSTSNINIAAIVMNVQNRETAIYKACSSCNKKLSEVAYGSYSCAKCGESDSYKSGMMFTLEVADFSGSAFVTMWKEQAERFLGLSAEKLAELKDDDPDQYNSVLDAVIFLPFEFRIAIKQETYRDEERLRWTVNNVQPLMPSKLIGLCQKMFNGKNGANGEMI